MILFIGDKESEEGNNGTQPEKRRKIDQPQQHNEGKKSQPGLHAFKSHISVDDQCPADNQSATCPPEKDKMPSNSQFYQSTQQPTAPSTTESPKSNASKPGLHEFKSHIRGDTAGDSQCNLDDHQNKSFLTNKQKAGLVYEYPDPHGNQTDFPNVSTSQPSTASIATSAIQVLGFMLLLWQFSNYVSNNAFSQLLGFIQHYFKMFGATNPAFLELSPMIPGSIYMAYKLTGLDKVTEGFDRLVVCPKCNATKPFKDCFSLDRFGNKIPSKCCSPVYIRNKYSGKCGEDLLHSTVGKGSTTKLVPRKVYCTKSISTQLETFLSRPGYEELCNSWRNLDPLPDYCAHISDSKMWKQFQKQGFFSKMHDLGFNMHHDFFKPNKHRNRSIGIIFFTVLNLEQGIRYSLENIILGGIIPCMDYTDDKGTHHIEPTSLDPFLKPIVDELLTLESGVSLKTFKHTTGIDVRAIVLLTACDSPAARKLVGFLAHSALLGCTQCRKVFPGKVGEKRYGGFSDYWPPRTGKAHRENVEKIKKAKNKTEKEKLESKFGCRNSEMLRLEYYDPIKMNIVDPMHCLYLGIAKAFFKALVKFEILTTLKLQSLFENVKSIFNPFENAWIPDQIHCNWMNMNAYEWRQWTLVYSVLAFYGVIPDDYLAIWVIFVQACTLISSPVVSKEDVTEAKRLFREFGRKFERKFGSDEVKPNIHFACHIPECMENYGSMYNFWCFGMERINGFLGDYKNNSRDLEETIMRKFLSHNYLMGKSNDIPDFLKDMFPSFFPKTVKVLRKSLTLPSRLQLSHILPLNECLNYWKILDHITLPNGLKYLVLDRDDRELMKAMYSTLYPDNVITLSDVGQVAEQFYSVTIGGQHISVLSKHPSKLCFVKAYWSDNDGTVSPESYMVGQIRYFIRHGIRLNDQFVSHILCAMVWFKEMDGHEGVCMKYPFPTYPFKVRERVPPGSSGFMPIQRIHSLCAYSKRMVYGYNECMVAAPMKLNVAYS